MHSNWLQNFTENRVFNYRWFGMIFYLDANTPPPQLLETNVSLGSFNYVFPQHEQYRQECMEKIISYIGAEVAKKIKDLKDKISSAKEMDELDRKIRSLDLYKKKKGNPKKLKKGKRVKDNMKTVKGKMKRDKNFKAYKKRIKKKNIIKF